VGIELTIKEKIIRLKFKINLIKMKTLFLLVLALVFFGCDNNPVIQEKTLAPADTLYFGVFQNYGYCDSQCVGESVILINRKAVSDRGYGYAFQTGDDSLYAGGLWLTTESFCLTYHSTGSYPFRFEMGDEVLYLSGDGLQQVFLDCSTNYNIIIQ